MQGDLRVCFSNLGPARLEGRHSTGPAVGQEQPENTDLAGQSGCRPLGLLVLDLPLFLAVELYSPHWHLLRNGLLSELGLHRLPGLDSNMFSLLPSCLLHYRPAWYDLPPPPYSSDTESLNQAELPPYRSRSGSAYSASSQAASSLLSVEESGHSPEQPGPPEGTAEPRDSVPSQGTEEV